jgi:hypothetical protein
VKQLVIDLGYTELAPYFANINGAQFAALSSFTLKTEFNVTKSLDRQRILTVITSLLSENVGIPNNMKK